MTQPTNTFSSYDAVGNREDLIDKIYELFTDDTPFLSNVNRKSATARTHEWQNDSLAASSSDNAVIEGDEASNDAITATVRRGNNTQISDKTIVVSGTQEKVNKAGRKSEMAREAKKKMKELKRDVEKRLLDNKAKVTGNDTLARECAGLQSWLITNVNKASDGTLATGDGTNTYTDGTARAFQESFLEDILAQCWDEGGMPSELYLNAFQKRKMAAFSGNSTSNRDQSGKKIVNSVDVYVDPLGHEVRAIPCRQCPTDVVYAVDPDYIALAVLRDFQVKDLAITGDYLRKQMLVEYTLEVNEKAHGGIFDLTTS